MGWAHETMREYMPANGAQRFVWRQTNLKVRLIGKEIIGVTYQPTKPVRLNETTERELFRFPVSDGVEYAVMNEINRFLPREPAKCTLGSFGEAVRWRY